MRKVNNIAATSLLNRALDHMTLPQPLRGLDILLTRPVGSAPGFIRQLRLEGARALNLPLLSVRVLPDSAERQVALERAESADAVVFASPTAVRACFRLRPAFRARGCVFAQGPATARSLARHGVIATTPTQGYTTEDLLHLPFFQAPKDKRIVRLAGVGGRDLLLTALSALAAEASAIALYERVAARWSVHHRALLGRFDDPVLVISSAESLHELSARLAAAEWAALRHCRLLVSSARLRSAAHEIGFVRVQLAASAASADLRAGLLALANASRGR